MQQTFPVVECKTSRFSDVILPFNHPLTQLLMVDRGNQPLRVVAIGDSLIYGFGDPEGGGWVERLRRRWMACEGAPVLYNLGVRGDGVRHVGQRLEGEFRHRGEIRHRLPEVAILSVGLNDSARVGRPTGRNLTAFEDFEFEVANLLDRAYELGSVLVVGMTPVDETRMPFANCLYYNHADQQRYAHAMRSACQARHIPYLDILNRWLDRGEAWWRSRLCQDGLHPNSLGYQALLQDFLEWQ
jgi:lysophospholipase L1-like esterase